MMSNETKFEMRHPVALTAIPYGTAGHAILFAVADDGTTWRLETWNAREGWSSVPALPPRRVKQ